MTSLMRPSTLVDRFLVRNCSAAVTDRFGIGLHFNLRNGFHGDGDALLGVELLLRSDVEGHQLRGTARGRFRTMGKMTVP
jgi:hypothetical protein